MFDLLKAANVAICIHEKPVWKVFLYFGSAWCPDCTSVTPKVFNECAKRAANDAYSLVYVSSDRSNEQMMENLDKFNSDSVLAIGYESELRSELKQTTGCFAGSEQSNWPEVSRQHGIPSLYTLDEVDGIVFVHEY